jgi:IS605 OrfB family transposase
MPFAGTKVAGIDPRLRNLAVVNCEGRALFVSGDLAAYMRRRYAAIRRRMGQAKALRAILKMKDKEARWMKDQDHQISRVIVNLCAANEVGLIRMEDLAGIRIRGNRARKDQGRSLHCWSFHRLQRYIAYKAVLAGITVEWVVPTNTSRACPVCGVIDKASRQGIKFQCTACGHQEHADSVGARNVASAISGLAAV